MAQPNVAREPSMEEILASIRRIIESNEPNAENVPSQQLPSYGEDELEEQDEASFAPDMVANDRGLPSHNEPMNFSAPSLSQPAQPERTLSLADVAARVRAASARQQEAIVARPVATSSASEEPLAHAPVQAARREQPTPAPRVPEFREPMATAPQAPATDEAPPHSEAVRRPTPLVFEPLQPAPASAEAAPPVKETRPKAPFVAEAAPSSLPAKIEETANLLSREAGAQVARSFSELAAVFNGMERRSLEDMAGEMLRPMLQEWLDDNLPTLVERLVREEIERVAHGGRR